MQNKKENKSMINVVNVEVVSYVRVNSSYPGLYQRVMPGPSPNSRSQESRGTEPRKLSRVEGRRKDTLPHATSEAARPD